MPFTPPIPDYSSFFNQPRNNFYQFPFYFEGFWMDLSKKMYGFYPGTVANSNDIEAAINHAQQQGQPIEIIVQPGFYITVTEDGQLLVKPDNSPDKEFETVISGFGEEVRTAIGSDHNKAANHVYRWAALGLKLGRDPVFIRQDENPIIGSN